MRVRVSPIKSIQVNWPHVLAFLLTVGGLVIAFLQHHLSSGSPITWAAAMAALAGPVWMAFLNNVVQVNPPPMSFADAEATIPDISKPRPPVQEDRRLMLSLAPFVCLWAMVLAMVVLVMGVDGCIPNPSGQAQDAAALAGCVVANWGKPPAEVIATCGPAEEQAILDIIADFVVLLEHPGDAGAPIVSAYASDPEVSKHLPAARARWVAAHAAQGSTL